MSEKEEKETENYENENENNNENHEEKKRKIVIPGEVIISGKNYLPGEGTQKEGDDIIALKYGLGEESGRLVKIIPLSGVYIPRKGNVVIGRVEDITFNGWVIEINAPYSSFLQVAEAPRYLDKENLSEFLDIGDLLVAKIYSINPRGIDLALKDRGLGKIEEGMIIYINPSRVPRVIGREGSMVNLIKNETNCKITVGQNGVIWIKGQDVEDELFAKKAILFAAEKSYVEGLTEKVKEFLDKEKKKRSK